MALRIPRIQIQKILDSARGEACTLEFDGCLGRHPSVSFCHSNMAIHGKGRGIKAHDIFGAYGCDNCHGKYDGRKKDKETELSSWPEFKFYRFQDAMAQTQIKLIQKEILK